MTAEVQRVRTGAEQSDEIVFSIRNLEKRFRIGSSARPWRSRWLRALQGIDLEIRRGEAFGLVGESGCGKSTLARLLLLLERPTGGVIQFHGADTSGLHGSAEKAFRRRVQAVLQNPYSSLNPRMSIRDIVAEPLEALTGQSKKANDERVCELLEQVGLNPSLRHRYPHQFSGGQQQRVAIARALSVRPEVLVLDEPTSALDVSVRAQIINLLLDIKRRYALTLLFISHDLAIVEQICDRVGVMYAGEIVEVGDATDVILSAKHPYTQALVRSIPALDPRMTR